MLPLGMSRAISWPADARAQVAQQVESQAFERIVPALGAQTGLIDIDAELLVLRAFFLQLVPIAGGQRKTVAVVDAALGNVARDLLEARIVLVAARAIGLYDQGAFAHDGAAVQHLDVG